jgi:hypothetical protein
MPEAAPYFCPAPIRVFQSFASQIGATEGVDGGIASPIFRFSRRLLAQIAIKQFLPEGLALEQIPIPAFQEIRISSGR